jgi:sulfate-transporting ATPase
MWGRGEASHALRARPRFGSSRSRAGVTKRRIPLRDDPTNDLDVNTLRTLEDALYKFAGCAGVISRDRWFLDRIATHILAFEGESKVTFFVSPRRSPMAELWLSNEAVE